ncbi:MAG: DUF3575 domain-containing protein [Bacteroidota bacterium]|nr:DUF3575 domain-containing protein [Bacteroidota bacterium]
MKKLLLLKSVAIAAISIFSSLNTSAQTEGKPERVLDNVIKFNPISLAVGTANVQFEHAFKDRYSWQLGVAYMFDYKDKEDRIYDNGLLITPEFRIRLFDKMGDGDRPIQGFYAAPFARWIGAKTRKDVTRFTSDNKPYIFTEKYNLTQVQIGCTGGYELLFGRFVVDGFVGPYVNAYSRYKKLEDNSTGRKLDGSPFAKTIGLRAGLSLGFAF